MNPAEAYILNAKEPYRTMLLHLQVVIETTLPDLQLLYKWKLPFYYIDGKQGFCFFNQSKDYVDLVFYHGTHLSMHQDKMISENRKHMKSLRYFRIEDIDDRVLIDVLREAYSFRERKYYK